MNIALTGEKDLLEQARKALIEMEYEETIKWDKEVLDRWDVWYLIIYKHGTFCLHPHYGCYDNKVIILTPSNFNEVINQFKK